MKKILLPLASILPVLSFAAEPESECALYPIALDYESIAQKAPGEIIGNALNGQQPGNFGWLTWSGSPSAKYLADSLSESRAANDYRNPRDADDTALNAGDWVHGSPGAPNSKAVKNALDDLVGAEIVIPVWDESTGQGNNAEYHVVGFARVQLLGYDLKGDDRITVAFLGFASCSVINQPPTVDAGDDVLAFTGETVALSGSVADDGNPPLAELTGEWTVVSGPGEPLFSDPNALNSTIVFQQPGIYTLRLSASDSELQSFDELVVQVDLPNHPPAAFDGEATGQEDTEIAVQPIAQDQDGDLLSYHVVAEPAYGTVRFESPNFIYTPLPDTFGEDRFQFKARDGELESNTATVTVTVLPVNDPPVADDQNHEMRQAETLDLALSGADIDSETLSYEVVDGPLNGSLTGADTLWTYEPNVPFHGTETLTYRADDGELNSALATITIYVEQTIFTPLPAADAYSLDEDTSLVVEPTDLLANDAEVQEPYATLAIDSYPVHGVLELLPEGSYQYRPDADYFGEDSFTYTVSQAGLTSEPCTVVLTVNPVNDAPIAEDVELSILEDETAAGVFADSDADGDTLTFALASEPTAGVATVKADGTYVYQPGLDYYGTDAFAITVTDGEATAEFQVRISVAPVNDAPVASEVNYSTAEDTLLTGTLIAADADQDPLIFSVETPPANGSVTVGTDGAFTFAPALDYHGESSFEVRVEDLFGAFASFVVGVTVTPVNDEPVPGDVSLTTLEDAAVSGELVATDVDGDALTFTLVAPPTNGTATVSADGGYSYEPHENYNGLDLLTASVTDGAATVEFHISVSVIPVNDAPSAANLDVETNENAPVDFNLPVDDIDGDSLDIIWINPPSKGSIRANDGGYTYIPESGLFGTEVIEYKVTDGEHESEIRYIYVDVQPVNDNPSEIQTIDWNESTLTSVGVGGAYQFKDIGYGSSSGAWSIAWQGGQLGDVADRFHFGYLKIAGSTEITVSVDRMTTTNGPGQAGLMLRSATNAGSAFMSVAVTSDENLVIWSRPDDGVVADSVTLDWVGLPQYLRLARVGEFVRAFASDDGNHWRLVEQRTVELPSNYLGGLYCSDDQEGMTICEFSDLAVTPVEPDAFRDFYLVAEIGDAVTYSDVVFDDEAESYRIASASGDFSSTSDGTTMVYVPIDADFVFTTQLLSLAGDPFAGEAGVSVRGTLEAGSPVVSLSQSLDGLVKAVRREAVHGEAEVLNTVPSESGFFLRLSKTGQSIAAAYSDDGFTWNLVTETSFDIGGPLYLGLYSSGTDAEAAVESAFGSVSLEILRDLDHADFVSQSLPYAVEVSSSPAFNVEFINSGTTIWEDGYGLSWAGDGVSPWGITKIALPEGISVHPDESYEFEFNVTAPSSEGAYASVWSLSNASGQRFGAVSELVDIHVANDTISLDVDGDQIPDQWEVLYFGHTDRGADDDFDGDGLTEKEEYHAGSDPTDYYNGQLPDLTLIDGDGQIGFVGETLPIALRVKVSSNGQPLSGAPINFRVAEGEGSISNRFIDEKTESIRVLTDEGGLASAYFKIEGADPVTSVVEAFVDVGQSRSSVYFSESVINAFPERDSIVMKLNQGEKGADYIKLTNALDQTVSYSLSPSTVRVPVEYSLSTSEDEGGPDFEWTDIQATGTLLRKVSNDNYKVESEPFQLSFSFPFYNQEFTEIHVSSHGYVSLGREVNVWGPVEAFPTDASPFNILAPFFNSDLQTPENGNVYVQDFGDRAIVQYDRIDGDWGDLVTFQVVLKPDGDIYYLYEEMQAESWNALIGVQGPSEEQGMTVSAWDSFTKDEFAIRISPNHQWLSVSSESLDEPMGIIEPGATDHILFNFDATNLSAGEYTQNLVIESDYVGRETQTVHVKLLVNERPNVELASELGGRTLLVGQSLELQLKATDPDGSVAAVQIVSNGTIWAEADGAELAYDWLASGSGNFELWARATDGAGATSQSQSINVRVENDVDADGMGDAWEVSNFGDLSQAASDDYDGDGLSNLDAFTLGLSPTGRDFDGDGMPDVLELVHGFDPTRSDGLDDADGDGYPNVYEIINASDPKDASSIPLPHFTVEADGRGSHATIQNAINAVVADYQIVAIGPGTYRGTGNLALFVPFNRKLMIVSTSGAERTILDGERLRNGIRGYSVVVDGLTFLNNRGGAVNLQRSGAVVSNCRIIGATASEGAPILLRGEDVRVVRCEVRDCHSGSTAGGILFAGGDGRIEASIVSNCSGGYAGAIQVSDSTLVIDQSTLIGNAATNLGEEPADGIRVDSAGARLENSICWNSPNRDISLRSGGVAVTYSNLSSLHPGPGNISIDPLLSADGRLTSVSACRGAGALLIDSITDVDREKRESGDRSDMGADQFIDTDGDLLPDRWELDHFGDLAQQSGSDDPDSDAVSNAFEYTYGLDPNAIGNADPDGDGLSDYSEIFAHGTNPMLKDSDGDGMPDAYEVANELDPHRNDAYEDLDGDRFPNIYEWANGSVANEVNDVPTPHFVVDASGAVGTYSRVQDAIDAVYGDFQIIEIAAGIYREHTNPRIGLVSDHRTMLVSRNGAAETVLDGQSVRGGLLALVDTVVDGITFWRAASEGLYSDEPAIGVRGGTFYLRNSIVKDGRNGYYPAISLNRGDLDMRHCTIFGNFAASGAASVDAYFSRVYISDSILWNLSHEEITNFESAIEISNSIVRGGANGAMDVDPLLARDGHLTAFSPAIGSGSREVGIDIDGERRVGGEASDIGADEFLDGDGDDLPDHWELRHFNDIALYGGFDDANGDGASLLDEYAASSNPMTSEDSDGDGLSDAEEVMTYRTDPNHQDTDRDGMLDSVEIEFSLDPLRDDSREDTDGDRYPNIWEVAHGSNPTQAESIPAADYIVATTLAASGATHSDLARAVEEADVAAQAYRIVLVRDGIYTGWRNKDLYNFRNTLLIISENGAANAVIDGEGSGRGLYIDAPSVVDGFTIQNMSSGGLALTSNPIVISNCVVRDNRASSVGGGVRLVNSASVSFVHCSIFNNESDSSGNGMGISVGSFAAFHNSILWNPGDSSEIKGGGRAEFHNSIVRDSSQGEGSLDVDPLLRVDGHLRYLSPARAAGSSGPFSAFDMDGENRSLAAAPDIGADQYSGLGVADADEDGMLDDWELVNGLNTELFDSYEDLDGDGFDNIYEFSHGTNPHDEESFPTFDALVDRDHGDLSESDNIYSSIQEVIDAIEAPYSIVEVADGVYPESIFLSGANQKGLMLKSRGGPLVTRIDGGGSDFGIETLVDLRLIGFTIANCRAPIGSALLVDGADVSLSNCLFWGNFSEDSGILAASQSKLALTNVTFSRNETAGDGGAAILGTRGSEATIRNSILWNAQAGLEVLNDDADAVRISSSIFRDGSAFALGENVSYTDPQVGGYYGHLDTSSPAIDAGSLDEFAAFDLDGEARPIGPLPDIGVDEFSDSDFDGLNDGWETAYFGDLASSADDDADGDGLTNAEELRAGSDPSNVDTDGDGLSDYDEYRVHGSDPLSDDTDRDGIKDAQEVLLGLDPSSDDLETDRDEDGLVAAVELEIGTKPDDPDTDGDGLLDGLEETFGYAPLVADYIAPDETPPPAPTGLQKLAVTSSSVTLSWNPVSDPSSPVTYEIWRNELLVGRTENTSFEDKYGYDGVYAFEYYVTAVDAQGNESSYVGAISGSTAEGFSPLPGDADGDGMPDESDPFPNDPANAFEDDDGDGIPNYLDPQPSESAGLPFLVKILNNDERVNYVAGESMRLTVSAQDPGATVEVFRNGVPIGVATRGEDGVYVFNWEDMPPGLFNIRVIARNADSVIVATKTFLVDVAEVEAYITFVAAPQNGIFGDNYSIETRLDGEVIQRPILRNRPFESDPMDADQGIWVHNEQFYRGDRRVRIMRDGTKVATFDLNADGMTLDKNYPLVHLREIGSTLAVVPVAESEPAPGGTLVKVANFTSRAISGGLSESILFWDVVDYLNEDGTAEREVSGLLGGLEEVDRNQYKDVSLPSLPWQGSVTYANLDHPNVSHSVHDAIISGLPGVESGIYRGYTALPRVHVREGDRVFAHFYQKERTVVGEAISAPVLPTIRITPYNVGSINYPGGRGHPLNNEKPFSLMAPFDALGSISESQSIVRVEILVDPRGRLDAQKINIRLPSNADGVPEVEAYLGTPEGGPAKLVGSTIELDIEDPSSPQGAVLYFRGTGPRSNAQLEVDVLGGDGIPINRVNSSLGSPERLRIDFVQGLEVEWDSSHQTEPYLKVLAAGEAIENKENSTSVRAVTTPPGRAVRYAIALWEVEPGQQKTPNSVPYLNEETGEVRAGDSRGELWLYAYDADVPSVQTRPRLITIGGCSSCEEDAVTCIDANLDRMRLSLNLGSAGRLLLDVGLPTKSLTFPSELKYGHGKASAIPVYDGQGNLTEIQSEEFFARIEPQSDVAYLVSTYDVDDLDHPISEVLVENPDPVAHPNGEVLRISQTYFAGSSLPGGTGADSVREFRFDSATGAWSLIEGLEDAGQPGERFLHGASLRRELVSLTSTPIEGQGVVETLCRIAPDGTTLSERSSTYVEGDGGSLLLEERQVRENEDDLVTTYDYYPDGLLKSVQSFDGSWSYYEYAESGLISKTVEPWLNAPFGTSGPDKQVTTYNYAPDPALGDTGEEHPDAPRTITVTVDGKIISLQKVVYGPGHKRVIEGGLETVAYYVTEGQFKGRAERIVHPDGTESHFAYSGGGSAGESVTVSRGAVDGEGNLVEGTRSETISDRKGRALISETYDIASGIIIQSRVATDFDAYGRIIEWTEPDGRTTRRQFGCCGVEWEEDVLGIRTYYTYDSLKRVKTSTRQGIVTTRNYDELGRQISSTLTGSEGGIITVSTTQYADADSQAYDSFDPIGRKTSMTTEYIADGSTQTTTTLPGGFTEVQTFARSGELLSIGGTAVSPSLYRYRVEEDPETGEVFTVQRIISSSDPTSEEWVESWSDSLGRSTRIVYPDGAEETSHYNAKGQLERTVDADGVATLYAYDALGQQTTVAVDLNGNGVIDKTGPDPVDRVTESGSEYATSSRDDVEYDVRRTVTSVYTEAGPVDVSLAETTTDGLHSWFAQGEATTSQEAFYPESADGTYSIYSYAASGAYQLQQFVEGRLDSSSSYDSEGVLLQRISFGYDQFGRQNATTDSRLGTTTVTFFDDGQIDAITAPDPESTDPTATLVTSQLYNERGLLETRTLPDGSTVSFAYDARGQLESTEGSQAYPVQYGYDEQGRLETMTTWQDKSGSGGAAVTTWQYHPQRGFLSAKFDAEGQAVRYAYTPAGRLETRMWSRGIVTTYGYTAAGQLSTVDYSDETPDVAYQYYRAGQVKEVRDGMLVEGSIADTDIRFRHDYTYDSHLRPNTERARVDGDYTLTRSYQSGAQAGDVKGRYDGFSMKESAAASDLYTVDYDFDAAGRLHRVNSAAGTFTYGYQAAGLLVRIEGPVHTAAFVRQPRGNAVRSLTNKLPDEAVVSRFAYRYNALGQRRDVVQNGSAFAEGMYFDYGYNAKGEVTGAARYLGTDPDLPGTPIDPESFLYAYDDIGNRLQSNGLDEEKSYSANILNQYDQIEDLTGGEPIEVPVHDADGNLAQDRRFNYVWNGENRLIKVTSRSLVEGANKLEFAYDYQGRRVQKMVYAWDADASIFNLQSSIGYLYDGWNLIAEFRADSDLEPGISDLTTFVWGLDLSGTMRGAGGVGGLMAVTESDGSSFYPLYDANGNVSEYVDSAGAIVAHYEYGPFGEQIRSGGSLADEFEYRFSTKYEDAETDLLYYGYRYYDAEKGRWLSRDPIGEEGGLNLYGMVGNDPVNRYDLLGLIKRGDIESGRTVYSLKAGWIDKAHARGTAQAARVIQRAMADYERNPSDETDILRRSTGQRGSSFSAIVFFNYDYARNLSSKERVQLVLGIELQFQTHWETYQGTLLGGDLYSKSSFSVEDLPSDFLGVLVGTGVFGSFEEMLSSMEALSKHESLCVWDKGKSSEPRRNRSYIPKLWRSSAPAGGEIHSVFREYTPAKEPNGFEILNPRGNFSFERLF